MYARLLSTFHLIQEVHFWQLQLDGGGAFFGRGDPRFAAKTGPLGPLLATENGPRVHFWQQKVDRGAVLTRATFSMTVPLYF